MIRDTSRLPTGKEIQRQKDLISAPIDFTGLIEAGVLENKGAWYVVHRTNELPEHVLAQVVETQIQNKTGQKSVIMVKFRRSVKSA
jgi:hypothetical protein